MKVNQGILILPTQELMGRSTEMSMHDKKIYIIKC